MGATVHYCGRIDDLDRFEDFEDRDGWGRVQLRRALRGAAFARGALFALRGEGVIDPATFDELRHTVESLRADILGELKRAQDASGEAD